jgi:hypothetical protein
MKFDGDSTCASEVFTKFADDSGVFGKGKIVTDQEGFGNIKHRLVGTGNGNIIDCFSRKNLGGAEAMWALSRSCCCSGVMRLHLLD